MLTRREFVKVAGAGAIGGPALMEVGCTKNDVTTNAGYVLTGLRAATPLINQLLPTAAPKIAQATAIAEKLNSAIAASDSLGAVGFLRDLIPVFEDIVSHDVHQLPVELQTKVLAALAIVDIGLAFLATYYLKNLPATKDVGGADVIKAFGGKEVWGNAFKR
jgi:hypothetical protein